MIWEDKVKMIQAANGERWDEFTEIVTAGLDTMDGQAFDMFINAITITEEHLKLDREFLSKVIAKFHEVEHEASFRTAVRFEVLKMLIEDEDNNKRC